MYTQIGIYVHDNTNDKNNNGVGNNCTLIKRHYCINVYKRIYTFIYTYIYIHIHI